MGCQFRALTNQNIQTNFMKKLLPASSITSASASPPSSAVSQLFESSIAGSLPKPAWLAETNKLWPQWKAEGDALRQAKADATLLWIKAQEDAGLDIVGDGEQSRQHFVHGFLEQVEGIDFEHKVKMGIRDNRYDAMVPQVVSAAAPQGPRACLRGAAGARPHHAQAEVHAARPDDHRRHRGRQVLRRPEGRWPWPSPNC
jgi:5-methyltetrahydropteroyltriglutamate--homocysteine methyltransferase